MQGKRIGVMLDLATRPKYDPEVLAVFMQAVTDMENAGSSAFKLALWLTLQVQVLESCMLLCSSLVPTDFVGVKYSVWQLAGDKS